MHSKSPRLDGLSRTCRDRRSLVQSRLPQRGNLYSLLPFWAVWFFRSDHSLVLRFPQPIPTLLNLPGTGYFRAGPLSSASLILRIAQEAGCLETGRLQKLGAPFPIRNYAYQLLMWNKTTTTHTCF